MEERESEVAQSSGESGHTVSDIESISDCSEDDLARMESDINKRVVHDTTTGTSHFALRCTTDINRSHG